ncbi:MAG: hypothetical protein IPK94_06000 [Saprospiraceae bacterium]|nr:hypothetical protein [Saprospiraceae bacterium]
MGNVAEWTADDYRTDYYKLLADQTSNPWMMPSKNMATQSKLDPVDDDTDQLAFLPTQESGPGGR